MAMLLDYLHTVTLVFAMLAVMAWAARAFVPNLKWQMWSAGCIAVATAAATIRLLAAYVMH